MQNFTNDSHHQRFGLSNKIKNWYHLCFRVSKLSAFQNLLPLSQPVRLERGITIAKD